MEYFYMRDGIKEKVNEERWKWEAQYQDGTILRQFDDSGIFHQVGEIDQTKILAFVLYNGEKKISIVMPAGARIIHKYKHYRMNIGRDNEQMIKIYQIGYKYKGHYHFNYVLPDDTIVQSVAEQY